MQIGKRLVQLRESRGISGNSLAISAGVSQSSLNRVEKDQQKPTIDLLERLCETLGVTLSEFFAEDQDELSSDLRRLLETAKTLTSEQIKALQAFLETLERR